MIDSIRDDLNQVLGDDYSLGDGVPPHLVHYSSLSNLEKIVSSREVWLSSALNMNDLQELLHGMDEGSANFRSNRTLADACGSAEIHAMLIDAFDRRFHRFDVDHAMDTYVLCLSEHHAEEDEDGRLSMWRGYGDRGKGVALVFDSERLRPEASSPLVLGKISYVGEPDRIDWIDSKVSGIADVLKKHPKTPENLEAVAEAWIERLKMYSLFTKHQGFAEEEEWRIVFFSERDTARAYSARHGYVLTSKGVEQKLKLKIESVPSIAGPVVPIDQVIKRIILGPSLSTIQATNSVCRMLELVGCPVTVEVVASTIPFRP